MRKKIKKVYRDEWTTQTQGIQYGNGVYPLRHTKTWVDFYDKDEKGRTEFGDLDEDEIRSVFNRERITEQLVTLINDLLHNKWVECTQDRSGYYHVKVGELRKYAEQG